MKIFQPITDPKNPAAKASSELLQAFKDIFGEDSEQAYLDHKISAEVEFLEGCWNRVHFRGIEAETFSRIAAAEEYSALTIEYDVDEKKWNFYMSEFFYVEAKTARDAIIGFCRALLKDAEAETKTLRKACQKKARYKLGDAGIC